MRRLSTLVVALVMAACLVVGVLPAAVAEAGVHPLRGRWDLVAELEGEPINLRLLVATVGADPSDAAASLASGCLVSLDTGLSAPMSLRAVDQGGGALDVTFASTVAVDGGDLAVTRFNGSIELLGSGVSDDIADGDYAASVGVGTWFGAHHDRRKPKCGELDSDLLAFSPDAYLNWNDVESPNGWTLLGASTQIVSSGVRVESASIGTVTAPPFTDIFSIGVVSVEEFQFFAESDTLPSVGEEFTFVLLDLLGDPIPGTESSDVWNGCLHGAPQNLQATYTYEQHIDLSWDPVALVPGFDPTDGIGLYQIGMWSPTVDDGYGAMTEEGTTSHLLPWASFGGGDPGQPDGFDFGVSLSEFDDGDFWLSVYAFAMDVGPGGVGTSCQVSGEPMLVEKSGSDITITP